jgi:hypothetical protein
MKQMFLTIGVFSLISILAFIIVIGIYPKRVEDAEANSYAIEWTDYNDVVYDLIIYTDTGKSLTLSVSAGQLSIEADPNIYGEGAEAFFNDLIKPMCDAYIKSRQCPRCRKRLNIDDKEK